MDNIPEAVRPFKRTAWKPVVLDGDGEVEASKFSGVPWLALGEEWPVCGNCGLPIQLFVQLNLDKLPEALAGEYGSGLLQMFYCTNSEEMCEFQHEANESYSKSTLVRIVQPVGHQNEIETSPVDEVFPPKLIRDWVALEDYPDWQELKELGLELSDADVEAMDAAESPAIGDKLAGWPYWVQGIEYPDCPECDKSMRLVFQIDSEDNLPWMFGDSGTGHITQCATHKHRVAFDCACH